MLNDSDWQNSNMEAKIINLDRTDDPKTINEIVSKVVKMMNVNQIYLTIGEKQHAFTYRFIIITEDMAKIFREQVRDELNELFKPTHSFMPVSLPSITFVMKRISVTLSF